ncbi:MAG: aminotransferase class IV [Lachnospiraceae bacterium]
MILNADDGFFFGLGAFETIALEHGVPVFLDAHLKRLEHTANFLRISFSKKELKEKIDACLATLKNNNLRFALKITLSQENMLVTVRDNPYTAVDYRRGFYTYLSNVRRNETSPLVSHKTLNYGDNILEKHHAHNIGYDEPLFLNMKGNLAEGATTNVFLVKNGQIFTPSFSSGLLPGIMRDWVMSQIPVREKILPGKVIEHCDEIFLTNSLLGVMPVSKFGHRKLPSQKIGRELMTKYQEMAENLLF